MFTFASTEFNTFEGQAKNHLDTLKQIEVPFSEKKYCHENMILPGTSRFSRKRSAFF